METSVQKNPALLKLDLYCKGIQIDASCTLADDGRPMLRTRAGLGSGLEVVLPGGLYTNIPVEEKFVAATPYRLHKERGGYVIRRDGEFVGAVTILPEPAFYQQKTSSGKRMSAIGVLQGTYLGVYPGKVCHYWEETPKVNCQFCSVGLNLGTKEAHEKTVEDVVETALAARRDVGITFVHFNTGYYEGDTYLDGLEPYVQAIKQRTGLLVGVQTPPHPDFKRYDRLRKLGVNNVSFCFELWNKECFEKYCPGKASHVGQKRYLDAIAYCAKIFDTANGEIVAGLEPVEDTLRAIDWITSVGAIPTVCVFRPLLGTVAEDLPPPKTEDMIPVFRRLYEACMEHGLPVGIAPNIKVSIVLLPEECRYFLDDPDQYCWQEAKLWFVRKAFRAYFRAQLALRGS